MLEILALRRDLGPKFGMSVITPAEFGSKTGPRSPYDVVSLHRTELGPILGVYGRMVAAGEWKDYSMDFLRDVAIFSVFRRASETPLFRIEKRPKLATKQGQWAVIGHDGRVLKRGRDLKQVLRVFDAKMLRVID